MKIVATGRASQQQLQYFQKHIDELTELVRQRQEQEARAKAPAQTPAPAPVPAPVSATAPATPAQPIRPPQAPQMANPRPPQGTLTAPAPAPRPPAPTQYYHQAAPVVPRPKMVTTATPLHILLQFNENPNERFLFPKHSILEFNNNLTEVICSFVVVKRGKGDKEYWVPVSLTFKGDAPTLSVLGRVAEPVDVARRSMEDIILRYERAEEGYLAFRLPREPMAIDIS
jgi:hypothetical protein